MTNRYALRVLAASSIAAAFVAPVAFAQQAGTPPREPAERRASSAQPAQKTWAEFDTDRNGDLSKDEAAAIPSLEAIFDRADANADGALTGQEY